MCVLYTFVCARERLSILYWAVCFISFAVSEIIVRDLFETPDSGSANGVP